MRAYRRQAAVLAVASLAWFPVNLGHAHEHTKKPVEAPQATATASDTSPDKGADTSPGTASGTASDTSPGKGADAKAEGESNSAPAASPPESSAELRRPTYDRTLAETDWRQRVRRRREGVKRDWLEPGHFVFELRFGPYLPRVDEEFSDASCAGQSLCPPYASFFGSDPSFYFGLEVDWLPFHIPYVGSLGVGAGWGYVRASAKAKTATTDDSGQSSYGEAGSDTALNIFPMHLSGVLRLDGPLRKWGVPIAPYAKVGFGVGTWNVSGSNGTAVATAPDGTSVTAEGTSMGMHLALGASVALNVFDPTAAIAMREETGIRFAYVWGEWMYNDLGGSSDDELLIGTSTAVFGLGFDF
jgi:hypothetical protein